ncbi:extracellular solute-binding protein [Acrocarpospora macrocephala]|uniref:ABC transporter substrate-binding protein n=1 Tax=Acrocarpospora macrocephala TaxID=150177 RepID=A0A5M3WF85_9ACTN|nr:extracellular solute-binding protein [Acrocarpospora macrocephala]GES06989.1 ABC transporter substrate-binding protein [Acrocarpospora macrocephala]
MTPQRHKRAVARSAALVTAAMLALAGCSSSDDPGSAPQGPIVVANWGGLASKSYQTAYVDPYTKDTGIELQQVDAPGLFVARTKAQAAANRTEWDVLESITDSDAAFLADAGLLEPLPADLKARLIDQLGAENVTDYGYHSGGTAMLIICNTERVKVCPQSMAEFFDVEKFPQKRAIIGFNPIYPITAAQLALGVPRDKTSTTPIDVDAVFAKLEEIRPLSVIWSTVDQGTQVLEQGEADMGILYATRIYGELLPTGNYEVVWADGARAQGTTVVLKNAPHMKAAWNLVEWNATHLKEQAQFSVLAQKTAIDPASLEFVPADQRERFANAPEHDGELAVPNAVDYNAKFDKINQRFQEFISG